MFEFIQEVISVVHIFQEVISMLQISKGFFIYKICVWIWYSIAFFFSTIVNISLLIVIMKLKKL